MFTNSQLLGFRILYYNAIFQLGALLLITNSRSLIDCDLISNIQTAMNMDETIHISTNDCT